MAVFDEHAAIRAAVERRDPAGARAAMEAHLLKAARRSRLPLQRLAGESRAAAAPEGADADGLRHLTVVEGGRVDD
jgi:hypothetical protein